jgi:hypothetical protein
MDKLSSIILKLQASRTHLINNDITAAKLLINDSIAGLMGLVANLESVGLQAMDATTISNFEDLINAILSP